MCVTQSVRAHFSLQSCCMPWTSRQSKAATLNWRESDAPLRIITPPPDNKRHFKSTRPRPPPPSRLSYSLIAPVQEEITVLFFFSLPLSLSHTQSQIQHPMTFHFPLYNIHFSKNGDNYPGLPGLFYPPHPPTHPPKKGNYLQKQLLLHFSIYVEALLGPVSAAQ